MAIVETKAALNPTLPDDSVALIAAIQQHRNRPRTTVVEFMGGEMLLGDAVAQTQPVAEARSEYEKHVTRWAYFEAFAKSHPRLGIYANDMRAWEAWRARINLRRDSTWFFGMPPDGRLILVNYERRRLASERRLKLARERLRRLGQPNYYIDPNTSLRSA
ncbi:MAG: hypothetical protein QM754_18445 [Tepidisphaeraceae bacterium]